MTLAFMGLLYGMAGGGMYYGQHMMPWGYGLFGWIAMILFWAVVIGGVVYMVMRFLGKGGCCGIKGVHGHGHAEHTALDTLKERYAKGEIDKAEFDEKKKDLM